MDSLYRSATIYCFRFRFLADEDSLQAELIAIDDELNTIEVEIEQLLERQQALNERRSEVESLLESDFPTSGHGAASAAPLVDDTQWDKSGILK